MLMCGGVCLCVEVCVLMCGGVCLCVEVCAYVWRCVLMCGGVCAYVWRCVCAYVWRRALNGITLAESLASVQCSRPNIHCNQPTSSSRGYMYTPSMGVA